MNLVDPDGMQSVTREEYELAGQHKVDEFWRSRAARGDPIGLLGVQFGGEGFDLGVTVATARLWDAIFRRYDDSLVSRGFPMAMATEAELSVSHAAMSAMRAEWNEIRIALMFAHIRALEADDVGTAQFLSAEQIAEYHWQVFDRRGFPRSTFGGTPFTGTRFDLIWTRGWWCGQCDSH